MAARCWSTPPRPAASLTERTRIPETRPWTGRKGLALREVGSRSARGVDARCGGRGGSGAVATLAAVDWARGLDRGVPAVPHFGAVATLAASAEQEASSLAGVIDQSVAAQMSSGDTSTYLLISVLSGVAIAALLVLTGGVAYLAYSDWKDKQEVEELQKNAPVDGQKGKGQPAPSRVKESALGAAKGFGRKINEK